MSLDGKLSVDALTASLNGPSPREVIRAGSPQYFAVCGLGGAICCGGTHFVITPLDMIKCRMQVDIGRYPSIAAAGQAAFKADGLGGLVRGWAPTLLGYSLQGYAKFSFYEVFKVRFSQWAGEENAHKYRSLIYMSAAASAEALGDIALAPFEAVKVRIQTDRSAPHTMTRCMPMMVRQEGMRGLFKGLAPLWMRQIPYTASQFWCFELVSEYIYKHFVPKGRARCSNDERMAVSCVAASMAGVFCAVVSHPPDVLVSLMYKNSNMGFVDACKKMGVRGMWAGLHARMLMISSIAAFQLIIVDAVKVHFNCERPKN